VIVWHRHSCRCRHRQECLCHTAQPQVQRVVEAQIIRIIWQAEVGMIGAECGDLRRNRQARPERDVCDEICVAADTARVGHRCEAHRAAMLGMAVGARRSPGLNHGVRRLCVACRTLLIRDAAPWIMAGIASIRDVPHPGMRRRHAARHERAAVFRLGHFRHKDQSGDDHDGDRRDLREVRALQAIRGGEIGLPGL